MDSRGDNFTLYYLDGLARQWWCTFIETSLSGSLLVTWTKFSQYFLSRFIPRCKRDRLLDQFSKLEHDLMIVFGYEVTFHELSPHATLIIPTEDEIIWSLRAFIFLIWLTMPILSSTTPS